MHRTKPKKVETVSANYSASWADDEVLELPPFNRWGCLPDGVHDACFEAVLERFSGGATRKALCNRLQRFLLLVIDTNSCSHVYLSGDFVTRANAPKEIEVTLETRSGYGPDAFQAIEPLVALGLDTILKKFSVRLQFWCRGFPKSIDDFYGYFHQIRATPATANGIAGGIKKGIVRITL
jgi:hypothetical protein